MKTVIFVCSLMLAAPPVWAQQTASSVKRTLPAATSHVTPPPKPAAPPKTAAPAKTEKAPEAKPVVAKTPVTEAAANKPGVAKPSAEKPAGAKTPDTAESAAERIMRRLDEAFPKKAPGEKTAVKAPVTKAQPARYATSTGTPAPPRASNHVTLNWRIALHWPDEIAPAHQVK
jgi:outer membrane biosynthesis protein TonB